MNRHKSIRRATAWFVYTIVFSSAAIIGVTTLVLYRLVNLDRSAALHPSWLVVLVLIACAVAGVILAIPLSRRYLSPLSELIRATDAVANGDFSVRIPEDTAIGEFRRFIQSFNKMTESLAGAEMMRTDLINTISHEFKTPVVSIRGFAKLLQKPDLTEEQKKLYTDTIITQSQQLASMSSNILLLSQYENTAIMTGRELYSLDEQIRQCIRLQERDWLRKGIALAGELEAVTYYGNADFLGHLWSNLLSNAIKFTPEGGEITVSLTRSEGRIRVSFRDTGIGMDAETLRHIYDKFYQADASRQSAGNGLGLSIAKRIVSLCGGEIEARSKPGEGSEFIVTLPD